MKRGFSLTFLHVCLCTLVVVVSLDVATAQVRQSTNYKIQSDSLNMGGGFSSSTNYQSESTVGEVATGLSNSTNYYLKAGYQQMQEVYIAMSSPADVVMSPSLGGITGGTAYGSSTVTVTTDSPSGYSLTIAASGNPAMQKGVDSIANYVPVGANPDFSFTFGATEARFGFSPEGVDIVQRFRDNGIACNVGASDMTSACWDGISTTDSIVASKSSANHPSGSTTTILFAVGIGSSVSQPEGIYTATTTLTALPL